MSANTSTAPAPISDAEMIAAAGRARDEGMEAAENAADPRVILAIDRAIAKANATGKRWSANDIRKQFTVSSQGLVGGRVRAASMRRPLEMVKVDETASLLMSTHKKPIAVWVGVPRTTEAP